MQDLAMSALCEISTWPDGAQAVVDADIMKHVSEFLRSTRTSEISVRNWACEILGILMRNESTAAAVLPSTPCTTLVSFLRYFLLFTCVQLTPDGTILVTKTSGLTL